MLIDSEQQPAVAAQIIEKIIEKIGLDQEKLMVLLYLAQDEATDTAFVEGDLSARFFIAHNDNDQNTPEPDSAIALTAALRLLVNNEPEKLQLLDAQEQAFLKQGIATPTYLPHLH